MRRRTFLVVAALGFTTPAYARDQAAANDAGVLDFALQLEALQAALYAQALELDLGPGLRSLAAEYAAHGREHVELITRALRGLGEEPEERPRFGFDMESGESFRSVARDVEGIVVGAYNGAIPALLSSELRGLLARIVQVEAGHAATFSSPAAPRAFDAVLSQTVVAQRIDRYVRA